MASSVAAVKTRAGLPISTVAVAVLVPTTVVIWYSVIAALPGSSQLNSMWLTLAAPSTAAASRFSTLAGSPGAAVTGSDAGPAPRALTASTENVWAVPADNPVSTVWLILAGVVSVASVKSRSPTSTVAEVAVPVPTAVLIR